MADLWELDATAIASMVRQRDITAREVTESALARLAAVNPRVNAVVQEFPDEALATADRVDAAIANGQDPGPMAGVPVTIKVNIDMAGHANTNGLRLQKDQIAASNSPVADNFLRAGAIIIGRTNTPAFSMRWFTDNQLHGRTLNPHDPSITPGGSSGGASAAVASGIGAVGHGNDIGGSVRYPAYACGIHGLRPSFGRVAAFNASGSERSLGAQIMSVQGPLARSIGDVRLALAAMAGPDIRDPWWVPAPLEGPAYPKRAALCIRPDGLETVPEVEAALREAAARLTDAGWTVREFDALPPLRDLVPLQLALWFSSDGIENMRALVNREGDPGAMATLQNVLGKNLDAMDLPTYSSVLTRRATYLRQWMAFFEEWPAVLIPNSAHLPMPQDFDIQSEATGAITAEIQMTQLALPVLGLPGLSVAMDKVGQVPNGVQIIGSRFREDILLAAGDDIASRGAPVLPVTPV
ncbi:amidase [Gemmobacter megaterium]|uniref:Amidase n=1 Tax=Gemmobacter megaterium TaxID=1086013 RepID=A0A1N7PPM7_9RHOB|nr:amidase family protein [Gemmobacter megaterium]GGE20265.1 amidase [Gemmobacter megaterium]SIT12369.1 amidase [Gemmobacter megaterium]